MSLALKSIELVNIRSHEHVLFEPGEVGVTALSGANGAGKSTILDALAWVIYGTKPAGVSKALSIVRHGTDLRDARALGRVVVVVDGSELTIERRFVNKQGAVECEVWEQRPGEDAPSQIAGPSVSHAETYLRQRLRMDERGFLAAVLVQQKQVDHLISATPRERAEVIEKLTGISGITEAHREARQQLGVLKKSLANFTIDDTKLERLTADRERFTGELERDRAKLSKTSADLVKLEETAAAEQEKLAAEEEKLERTEAARTTITSVDASVSSYEAELARIGKMKDVKKAQLSSAARGADLGELEKQVGAVTAGIKDRERRIYRIDAELRQAQADIAAAEEALSDTEGGIADLESGLKTVTDAISAGQVRQKELTELAGTLKADMRKVASAIKVIEGEGGTCPTCLQTVPDVAVVTGALKKEGAGLRSQLDEAREEATVLRDELEGLTARQEELTGLISAAGSLPGLKESAAELTAGKTSLEAEVKAAEAELTGLRKAHAESKMYEDIKNEYEALLRNAVEVSDEIERLKARREEASETLRTVSPLSPQKIAALRKKFAGLAEKRNAATAAQGELRASVALLEERIKNLSREIADAETEALRYQDMLREAEVHARSVDVLDEFRTERIDKSVPVVSLYASDLLSRFTDGDFVRLSLNKKFEATVTRRNGAEMPVGLLSGGELSAAALALRLAISMLLNTGSSHSMIVLDEVLVSQDETRAERILGTIKDVCQGQVIMISHGPNTNEIADKVIEL